MRITTKGDLVNAALRKLGIASDATLTDIEPQSTSDAVDDLEMMMAEWYQDGAGIDAGYQFSSDEEVSEGDTHGMKSSAISAVVHNLALRIAPDYEVIPQTKLVTTARYGKELLYKSSAIARAKKAGSNGYPSRMPIGSGNITLRINNHNYFHRADDDDDNPATPI